MWNIKYLLLLKPLHSPVLTIYNSSADFHFGVRPADPRRIYIYILDHTEEHQETSWSGTSIHRFPCWIWRSNRKSGTPYALQHAIWCYSSIYMETRKHGNPNGSMHAWENLEGDNLHTFGRKGPHGGREEHTKRRRRINVHMVPILGTCSAESFGDGTQHVETISLCLVPRPVNIQKVVLSACLLVAKGL